MFEDCLELESIFQKEKYYKKKNSIDFHYDKKYNNNSVSSIIFNYVTNMTGMFFNCKSLKSLPDISKWNTNNVIDMSRMFYNCWSLISLSDISKWSTKNVNNMSQIFSNCQSLKSFPDISKWNTDNVNNMSFMFYYCKSLKSIPDISKWNTKNVHNMRGMIYNCWSLISLPDISKWKTKNLNDLSFMFYNCRSLISLPDVSKWNTDNLNDLSFMFSNCKSLKSLPDLSKWNTCNDLYNLGMFINCPVKNSFPNINHQDSKFEKITNKYIMTYKIKSEDYTIQILGEEFVQNNEKEGIIIYKNQKYHLVKELPIEKTNNDKLKIEMELSNNVCDLSNMFKNCESLVEFKEYNEIEEINKKQDNKDGELLAVEEYKRYFFCLNKYHYYEMKMKLV